MALATVRRTPGISCERPICSTLVCFIPLFAGSVIPSEILWLQARVLRHASEHLRTQLVAIVKGKGDVRPALSRQSPVGAGLALDDPPYLEERCEDA